MRTERACGVEASYPCGLPEDALNAPDSRCGCCATGLEPGTNEPDGGETTLNHGLDGWWPWMAEPVREGVEDGIQWQIMANDVLFSWQGYAHHPGRTCGDI